MPPKIKVTREAIISAAVEIVRNGGDGAINARNIASVLDCSTQPVFSNFTTMDELRLAVIKKADELGIPMIIRTPIITGINDTIENVVLTKEFVKTLKNAVKYELLPYHPLGISKAEALGITQQKFEIPSKAKMEELRKYADISR